MKLELSRYEARCSALPLLLHIVVSCVVLRLLNVVVRQIVFSRFGLKHTNVDQEQLGLVDEARSHFETCSSRQRIEQRF